MPHVQSASLEIFKFYAASLQASRADMHELGQCAVAW